MEFNEHLLMKDTDFMLTPAELESASATDTPNFDRSFFSKVTLHYFISLIFLIFIYLYISYIFIFELILLLF